MIRTPSNQKWPTLGDIAQKWMETNLVYGPGDLQGQDFRVDPYLKLFLDDLYRIHPKTGRRVVRRALLGVGKGGAKSEFEAAVDLFELMGPCVVDGKGRAVPRKSPDIPVAAASYEQADLVFSAANAMCEKISDLLDVYDKEISRKDGTGRMYRVAAAAGTNDGLRPTSVSIDELHEWTGKKKRVYLVLTNGLTKRQDSFEVSISTAGDPDSSDLLLNLYEYGKRVASGEVADASFVMHWYESDPALQIGIHEHLIEAIGQANPASWIDAERIAQRFEVDKIPQHEFERYHLNRWVSSGESWLPAGVWRELVDWKIVVEDGEKVVAGFDGSYNNDSTALVGCTLEGHLFEIAVWERPEKDAEWRVPRSEVDAAVADMFDRFDVVELACDPARWNLYMDEWAERYGDDRVIEYPNTRARMRPATAKFYDAAIGQLLTHDGSRVLARHVQNATIKEVPGGYVIQKDHPNRKIDAAIAAVMAYDRATWRRDNEEEYSSIELI